MEPGCADGSNVIPWAESAKHAIYRDRFLRAAIAQANNLLARLGLNNIQLHQLDMADFDPALGTFDYIVAHGVYSWVPPAIQQRVLAICNQHLAPNGIADISYNTYPGWHQRGLLRKLMLRYAANLDYADRPAQARAVLNYLEQALPENDKQADSLRATVAEMGHLDDHFLLHDELELENHPLYFHEFVERAGAFGLQFLTEAEFHSNPPPDFAVDLPAWCERGGERWLEIEQWFDAVNHRMFRQSLLCHADALLIDRTVDPQRIYSLYVAAPLSATNDPARCDDDSPVSFRHPNGTQLDVTERSIGLALQQLQQSWPQAVPFQALVSASQQGGSDATSALLADFLLLAYRQNLIELHSLPSPFIRTLSQRPVASPLARLQAVTHGLVTGRQHKSIGLDVFHRRLLQLLDGSRNVTRLIDQLGKEIMTGQLDLGQPIHRDKLALVLERQVPVCLERLAQGALLIA
ncbi:MAG: class I SAM-dependent methyltransferase [Candidatus Competibacteraceae bacterium]